MGSVSSAAAGLGETGWKTVDVEDFDQGEIDGVLGLKFKPRPINEKYLFAESGDPYRIPIEKLVKPLEFANLNEFGNERDNIFYIIDL